MDTNYKNKILTESLNARIREITEYQVNIDNFKLAINLIADDHELLNFKQQLDGLLSTSILEQRKAQIMLTVIQQQLEIQDVG